MTYRKHLIYIGFDTISSALTIGLFIQVTFNLFRFDPKAIHHENFTEMIHSLQERHQL